MKLKNKGFTLIELLVVVAIIGVLASIVLASLSSARAKARDARRQSDMKAIYNALVMYELEYGFAPRTVTYGEVNGGGWDTSAAGGFMTFLIDAGYMSIVPIDPINYDFNNNGSHQYKDYFYRYYCYPSGSSAGVRLDYRRVLVTYGKEHSLGKVNNSSDGFFKCGNHI